MRFEAVDVVVGVGVGGGGGSSGGETSSGCASDIFGRTGGRIGTIESK